MQSVIYARISKSDVYKLFGIGEPLFNHWLSQGLPCEPDGTYILTKVLRWYRAYNHTKAQRQIKPGSLSQWQLAELFGVTRQTVTAWNRAGLPKNQNDTYDLKNVCAWLRSHYQVSEKKVFQKRLDAIRKKLYRNVRQLERFIKR